MEVPADNTTDIIVKMLSEYAPLFPKSANFRFTVDDSRNHQTITSVQGMFLETVRVAPPRITLYAEGRFNIYFKRFSQAGLILTRENFSVTGDVRHTKHSCEYQVGVHGAFIDDFRQVFEWQKYSQEFDKLLEEELSKKPE